MYNIAMGKIHYIKGDATRPIGEGNKIIAHICNDIGGWGAGFVLAISKRWKEPERKYREWFHSGGNFSLGRIQIVQVEDTVSVANMIAQTGISPSRGVPPVRYDAVRTCLDNLAKTAAEMNAQIHMPRIGCGLAGGSWDKIEPIIQETLITRNIDVFVYDLN